MANSHPAISGKAFLLGLLLAAISLSSRSAGYQGFQDKVKKKDSKEVSKPEPKKTGPDVKELKPEQKPEILQKPAIKEVPKARKQLRPSAVKPNVKSIKIIKPKIKKH